MVCKQRRNQRPASCKRQLSEPSGVCGICSRYLLLCSNVLLGTALGRAFVLLERAMLAFPQTTAVISCLLFFLFFSLSPPPHLHVKFRWFWSQAVLCDSFLGLIKPKYLSPEPTAARQRGAAPRRDGVCDGASGMFEWACLSSVCSRSTRRHQHF